MAAYAFNEGAGTTVADASGNNNTGTINGATWTTLGRFGAALTFNGASNLVLIPASASLNVSSAMTLEAWIYPTASQSGWRTIMQREVDAYFLNASNDTGALRPSGGATFNGTVAFDHRHHGQSGEHLDARGAHLRRGDAAAVRQRHAGGKPGTHRRD